MTKKIVNNNLFQNIVDKTKYSISPSCNLLIWVCLPLRRIVFSELTAWCLDNLSGIDHQRQMIRV